MLVVSACLAGVQCRYDGQNVPDKDLEELVRSGKAIAVCPEVLGGLSIPRECCEIIANEKGQKSVYTKSHNEVTEAFKRGAEMTLAICKVVGADTAILKSKSPSCGCGKIYDGTFDGHLIDGNGMTADLLTKNSVRVLNESNWKKSLEIEL